MITFQKHSSHLVAVLTAVALAGCVKSDQANQSADSTARNLTLAPTESTAAMKDVPAPPTEAAKPAPEKKTPPPVAKPPAPKPAAPTTLTAAAGTQMSLAATDSIPPRPPKGGHAFTGPGCRAAAGAAAARGSRDIDIILPRGAAITIKLNKPLTVKRAA